MWELIRANKRRSVALLLLMLALMLSLGFVIGAALFPVSFNLNYGDPYGRHAYPAMDWLSVLPGGLLGMAVASVIWAVQAMVAYFRGGAILLSLSGAKPIEKADHPRLFNVVEEMTIASSLGKMPRVYVMDDMAMNAFAAGRDPDTACVAVTAGLLARLNRDELQGVVAHEISHIVNRDVLFMTMISIMAGTVVMLSEVVLRMFRHGLHGGNARYRGGKKGGGGAQVIVLVIALVFALLAPLLAQLIYFAVSRKREYLADAGAAVYTRFPGGLAGALEKIGADTHQLVVSKATAPMYIVNPLQGARAFHGFFATHPPLEERIQILRSLAGGVSYAKYQTAYNQVHGKGQLIPQSGLAVAAAPLRAADPGNAAQAGASHNQFREAGDLARNLNGFRFLSCACGARIKLPPAFAMQAVQCPRCHAGVALSAARENAPVTQPSATPRTPPRRRKPASSSAHAPLMAQRNAGAWQSVQCACGAVKNVAPSFEMSQTVCAQCGREIHFM